MKCKECGTEYEGNVCPNCGKHVVHGKKTVLAIALVICSSLLLIGIIGVCRLRGTDYKSVVSSEQRDNQNVSNIDVDHVDNTTANGNSTVKFTGVFYEFTESREYNKPADGNKIISAAFEFENTGKPEEKILYEDFHGYVNGCEVEQRYPIDEKELDLNAKFEVGKSGFGFVAFEVPKDVKEMEFEYLPNSSKSQKIVFGILKK